MKRIAISNLHARLWRKRLDEFAATAAAATPDDEGPMLRAAFALFVGASAGCVDALPSRAAFDTLLAAGGATSAALLLLPARAGFMLSRGSNGRILASVILPDSDGDMTGAGATPALALLASLAQALGGGSPELTLPPGGWLN